MATAGGAASLQDTIKKYQSITTRLKQVLEDKTRLLEEKDKQIAELTAGAGTSSEADSVLHPGEKVICRVEVPDVVGGAGGTGGAEGAGGADGADGVDGGRSWCYVGGGGSGSARWVEESRLVCDGGDATLPPPFAPAESLSRMDAALESSQKKLDVLKDEFRLYRIKMANVVRQHEADVAAANEKALAAQRTSLAGGGDPSDPDGIAEIKSLRDRVGRLTLQLSTAIEKETASRSKVARLSDEAKAAQAQADMWKTRAEALGSGSPSREDRPQKTDSDGATEGKGLGEVAALNSRVAELEDDLDRLQKEYSSYRRRAVSVLREKGEALKKATASSDGAAAAAHGDSTESKLPPKGAARDEGRRQSHSGPMGTPTDATSQREYLRNVMLQYMSTQDSKVRMQLEAAIAAVLQFSPADIIHIKESRASSGGIWSWLG